MSNCKLKLIYFEVCHLSLFYTLASSHETFISGFNPFCSKVHTPLGPRKSGIPAEVLMPAPVKNTAWLLQMNDLSITVQFSKLNLKFTSPESIYKESQLSLPLHGAHRIAQEAPIFLYCHKMITPLHNYTTFDLLSVDYFE